MPEYPSGTVAFLFTDIEGSTRRWEADPQAMRQAVARHFTILGEAIAAHRGVLFKSVGDAVQAAFPTAPGAVAAAVAAQVALLGETWGETGPLRVRMAVHVGEADPIDGDYLAPCLNRLARILAAGYGEQILLSEAARATVAAALPAGCDLLDLGAHRLRDLLQPEHIYQVRGPGLGSVFPPLKSLDRHLHNLPAQPTAILGREEEVASTRALFEAQGVRLVTLTGPGGTGKSRLGLQVGAELVERFADGVWFVPLATVTDPALVVPAIAQPLGVREAAGETLLTTLQDYLRPKHALLLLDNFEHLTAAAPAVAALLAACPRIQVLVTSREPLRIAGEREVPVPPLPLPTERQARGLPPAALLEYAAIQLFVARAQAVKPEFVLTETNAADVAAICRRLDGLPLAIELAAARARILTPVQLLARLDQRLKVLTGGARDLPTRQQTLRAAIEWSHDLLDPAEQTLFALMAVFSGGCTLDAAETVCGATGDLARDVLDGLESLTQKSLLRAEDGADGAPRFTMLETIREFGLERLDETGKAETLHRAHVDYFLEFVEEAEPRLTSHDQVIWLDRLGAEHDNVRSALGWLEEKDETEPRLRFAAALWRFWWMRGYLTEGRGWVERALVGGQAAPPAIRAKALSGAGVLAESQGDYEHAVDLHTEALDLFRSLGDDAGVAASLTDLGTIAGIYGDYGRAMELHQQALLTWQGLEVDQGIAASLLELGKVALARGEWNEAAPHLHESLRLFRRLGNASALAAVLESLGILAFYQEDYERAASYYAECLAACRELNDARMTAHALANLGEVRQLQGDVVQANDLYQEGLALFRELGDKRGVAFVVLQLGKVAMARGDLDQALALIAESLALRWDVGETIAVVESLEGLAVVACGRGDAEFGVRLFAAAEAHRLRLGSPLAASYREEQRRVLGQARASLGEAAFLEAWAHGQTLSLAEALNEVASIAPAVSIARTSIDRSAALA